ncbi:hypothetical protein OCH74_02350 [Bifidobacterium thermacidophilum]|jgi:hypothetical protein|uniref:Uncharacterized protein n=1 Tax=Bifidobacterium thermacidophilum TaxID=246618 RepID=A0ABW8KP01_9BIFI
MVWLVVGWFVLFSDWEILGRAAVLLRCGGCAAAGDGYRTVLVM